MLSSIFRPFLSQGSNSLSGIILFILTLTWLPDNSTAKEVDEPQLLQAISTANNIYLVKELTASPEIAFIEVEGETLLIHAARYGNYIAAIELVDAGADWLNRTSDEVAFCEFALQRLKLDESKLIGAAIMRRLRKEDSLLRDEALKEFFYARIAARQVPSYLSDTNAQCRRLIEINTRGGDTYAREQENLQSYFLEARILSNVLAAQDKTAAEDLFIDLVEYSLVSMPAQSEEFSFTGRGWSSLVSRLMELRAERALRIVLEDVASADALDQVVKNEAVSFPYLSGILFDQPYAAGVVGRDAFANRLASELKEHNQSDVLDLLYEKGLDSALPIDKYREWGTGVSKLFDISLARYLSIGDKRLFWSILQNRKEEGNSVSSMCCVERASFTQSVPHSFKYHDFLEMHLAGVRVDANLDDVFSFLEQFVESGAASAEEVASLINDTNGMSIYPITQGLVNQWIRNFITKRSLENTGRADILITHLLARNFRCEKKNSYGDNPCSVFKNGPWREDEQVISEFGPSIPINIWVGWGEIGANIEDEDYFIGADLFTKIFEQSVSDGTASTDTLKALYNWSISRNSSFAANLIKRLDQLEEFVGSSKLSPHTKTEISTLIQSWKRQADN